MNGTAIENFVCVIYNVSFMNCTWHIGRTAQGDTQYFLYWKSLSYGMMEDFMECQNYIKDNYGRNTGCRFQNVTIENKVAYFLVNASRSGQTIQSYKKNIALYTIEKLTPPLNVTVNCTGVSYGCEIQWKPPRTSHVERDNCFKYEIDVENVLKTTTTERSYRFPDYNAEKRYRVKIRATDGGCLVSKNWGEWSTPIEFGREQLISTSGYTVFLLSMITASLILFLFLALGEENNTSRTSVDMSAYSVFTTPFCCCSTCFLKKMSAPVPQPKDPFHGISSMHFQTDYENQLIKQETEEIITPVEEMA